MGKIIVSEFVTLDGVAQDPGGVGEFAQGGWAFKFDRGPHGDQFKLDEVLAAQALLLGRKTYEGFAEAWPSRTGEFADKMNAMPKYVASHTLTDARWNNTTILSGDPPEQVEHLRGEHDGDILVAGSTRLVGTLVEHDLVDEYRFMVFPTVLGVGERLFHHRDVSADLEFVELRRMGEAALLICQPKR